MAAILGRLQRSSRLTNHDLEGDPAAPQTCLLEAPLHLHGQVGQETLCLIHLGRRKQDGEDKRERGDKEGGEDGALTCVKRML